MDNLEVTKVSTSCYSYEVTMVVLVLASNEEEAVALLNTQGGYVSTRRVKLLEDKPIYNED
jgi:hypothetical protein